jgi:LPS sulfotransferase NodH
MKFLEQLLAAGEIKTFGQFLAEAPANVSFACRQDLVHVVRSALTAHAPSCLVAPIERIDCFLAQNLQVEQIIVIAPDDEDAACALVRRSLAGKGFPQPILETLNVVGFFADILPYFLVSPQTIRQRTWEGNSFAAPSPAGATKRCFILGAPRSGSTFLCSLLREAGLADPVEHLRPYVLDIAQVCQAVKFNFDRFLRRIVEAAAVGGVFSTKLISDFVFRVMAFLTEEQISAAAELVSAATVVTISRKDRLAQAVSWARAETTGRWHSYEAGEAPPADIPFDMIRGVMRLTVELDRKTAVLLAKTPKVIVVDYDELFANSSSVVAEICRELNAPSPPHVTSRVQKIADGWNTMAGDQFLAAFPDEEALNAPSLAELIEIERRKLQYHDRFVRARAKQIRAGHAQNRSGAYQDRHYWLLDYEAYALEGLPHLLRGPKPASLNPGGYGVCIGAAQTYGAFVPSPYPKLLGRALGIDILNLSGGGLGPRYFSESPRLLSLLADAKFVVVQAMSARMMPTSMFTPVDEMNLMRMRDGSGENLDAADVWGMALKQRTRDEVRALIDEAHDAWSKAMLTIASACQGPKIILWMSERPMHYEMDFDDVNKIFGPFPQLVDEKCMHSVSAQFDSVVECISSRGMPQKIVSHFSNETIPVLFGGPNVESQYISTINHYYPSPEIHEDAASALEKTLTELLRT